MRLLCCKCFCVTWWCNELGRAKKCSGRSGKWQRHPPESLTSWHTGGLMPLLLDTLERLGSCFWFTFTMIAVLFFSLLRTVANCDCSWSGQLASLSKMLGISWANGTGQVWKKYENEKGQWICGYLTKITGRWCGGVTVQWLWWVNLWMFYNLL